MNKEFNLSNEQEETIEEIEKTLIHKLVKIDFSWLMRRIANLQFNEREFIRLLKEGFYKWSKQRDDGEVSEEEFERDVINQLAGDKLIEEVVGE